MGKKERVIFISDTHIGATHSNFETYRNELLAAMGKADHVVLAGDIFELFFLKNEKHEEPREVIERYLEEQKNFLKNFLVQHPNIHLHFVLGNHENIRRFKNILDDLMQQHTNFEWHPEAIRLGDALVVHGDLQMAGQTNETRGEHRLRDAERGQRWAEILRRLDAPGHAVVESLRARESSVPIVHTELYRKSQQGKMRCRHERNEVDFHMDWVKHVFFGHTHVKFSNYAHDGILYHNLGAFTEICTTNGKDPGVLEATLEDGKITDVSEISLRMPRSRTR